MAVYPNQPLPVTGSILYNFIACFIHNPYIGINTFYRTDICIWIIQNMLFIGLLLNIKE